MTADADMLLALISELDQVRALALAVVERNAPQLWPAPAASADGPERTLHDLLLGARRAVFASPGAAKAVLDVLAEEGRRYAATPEGRDLRDRLVASDAVEQLRRIWETVSLNVLDGPANRPHGAPDAWVDLLTDAIAGRAGDDVVAQLRPEGFA